MDGDCDWSGTSREALRALIAEQRATIAAQEITIAELQQRITALE